MEFIKISQLLGSCYYAIPDYQRDYEWGVPENSTLLDDVFDLVVDSDLERKHFIGALVTVKYEPSNGINQPFSFSEYDINTDSVKHVVDGQQRITSISLLLSALKDIVLADQSVDVAIKEKLKTVITNLLVGSNWRSDYNYAPRVILSGNTGVCYNNDVLHVRDDVANKKYRGAKHLLSILKLFKDGIEKKRDSLIADHYFNNSISFYQKLLTVITERLTLVNIVCEESSNAFQVFDSLNGKGLDLTAADRIKNIMLSWANQNDKAAHKWDALVQLTTESYLANFFVTLFFYNCGERISKNKLPDKFKDVYKNRAVNSFTEFYNVLRDSAILYGCLRQNTTDNNEVNEMLRDLQQLGLDQVYVLLFSAASYYGVDSIKTVEYRNLIQAITSLVVRMQICEMSMNKLDVLFKKCIKAMKEENYTLEQITNIVLTEKSGITDSQFLESFKVFSTTDNKVCEFYLRNIENYIRKTRGNNRDKLSRNGLSVEHIIPKTLDDIEAWYDGESLPEEVEEDFTMGVQQNIGNKALLFADDNSSANDRKYSDKVKVYKEGKKNQDQGTPKDTFILISDLLVNYPTKFTHVEVQKRAKELASYAINIW